MRTSSAIVEVTVDDQAVLEDASDDAYNAGNGHLWRRIEAIRLLAQGASVPEVASIIGVSRVAIYDWARAWRQHGYAGLRLRTDRQEERLVKILRLREEEGLLWKQVARELHYKSEAGPLLALRRARKPSQPPDI